MGQRGSQWPKKPAVEQPCSNNRDDVGTVLILHEEKALIDSLLSVFEKSGFWVKTYASSHQLLAASLPNGPACLLACVSGDEKCGLKSYEHLKQNGVYFPVVFLASTCDFRLAIKAMRAGAEDLISLPGQETELLAAVNVALNRARQFVKSCENYLELRRSAALLTEREREVVKLVVAGMLNKEIADHLRLALVTVKVHRGNAMRKLGARTGAELARIARAAGIGDNPSQWPPNQISRDGNMGGEAGMPM